MTMGSGQAVIEVERLSKQYLIGHGFHRPDGSDSFREAVQRAMRSAARRTLDMARGRPMIEGDAVEEFWALKDVSFEVRQGEVVGIIGRNGAGKSTLLKILSRITEPTEGRVRIRGRVASLLEVGTGFHPELSGRENIFLNGAVLGMSKTEIARKFDEIVSFAGVEPFLDTPVKRYSSGMFVRLAFAVAAHLEPEILVIDEVLAVGDSEFQKKCLGKISEVAGGGRTVLFVSHNTAAVQTLCTKAILLNCGSLRAMGTPEDIIALYLDPAVQPVLPEQGHGVTVLNGLEICRAELPSRVVEGGPLGVAFRFRATRPGQLNQIAMLVHSTKGIRVGLVDLRPLVNLPFRFDEGQFSVVVQLDALPLVEGQYVLGLYLVTSDSAETVHNLAGLAVSSGESIGMHLPYALSERGYVNLEAEAEIRIDDAVSIR